MLFVSRLTDCLVLVVVAILPCFLEKVLNFECYSEVNKKGVSRNLPSKAHAAIAGTFHDLIFNDFLRRSFRGICCLAFVCLDLRTTGYQR